MRLALAVLALAACAHADRRAPERGDVSLTFTNHSARDVCGLHLASADAHLWGKSRLTDIVHVGERAAIAVPPGRYMLRAHACNDQRTVLVLYDVDVSAAHELVLHEPEAVEPAAPGRTAWPVTRWLSEASDWYYPTGMAAPGHQVTVDNRCARDLRLRLGARETTTVPARTDLRLVLPAGTEVALVDESQRPLTRHTTATGEQRLRIDAGCAAIAAG